MQKWKLKVHVHSPDPSISVGVGVQVSTAKSCNHHFQAIIQVHLQCGDQNSVTNMVGIHMINERAEERLKILVIASLDGLQ